MKFGLAGCGRIAQKHAEQMAARGQLIAVCDTISEKADRLALDYNAKAYHTLEEMLVAEPDLDIVSVCTPNGLHAAHSIAVLRAGKHVVCEKPMAITTADCRTMIEAADKAGKIIFVVMQNRFNAPVLAVKRLIDENKLGRIFSVQMNCFWNRNPAYYRNSWKGTMELDGGTLFTQFSHFIDLLYWMIGDVKEVQATLANLNHRHIIEFEDTGVVNLVFENGVLGSLHYTVNTHHTNMEGSFTLFAEKGTVKIGGAYLNRIDYQDIEGYTIPEPAGDGGANQYGTYQGSMSNHDKVYENLVRVLEKKEPAYISATDGLKTVSIIEKIYSFARRLS